MNICKNCRHFKNESLGGTSYGKCRLTIKYFPSRIDPVKGTTIPPTSNMTYAFIERDSFMGDRCGPDGKLYEYESDYKKRIWNEHGGTITYIGYLIILIASICLIKKKS